MLRKTVAPCLPDHFDGQIYIFLGWMKSVFAFYLLT